MPPPIPAEQPPPVIAYYRIWCALFAVGYAGLALYGAAKYLGYIEPSLDGMEDLFTRGNEEARRELLATDRKDSLPVAVFCAGAALLYAAAAAMVKRTYTGWTIGMIAICASIFPFCITVAGMVPLLIHWLKPETKRYFGCWFPRAVGAAVPPKIQR